MNAPRLTARLEAVAAGCALSPPRRQTFLVYDPPATTQFWGLSTVEWYVWPAAGPHPLAPTGIVAYVLSASVWVAALEPWWRLADHLKGLRHSFVAAHATPEVAVLRLFAAMRAETRKLQDQLRVLDVDKALGGRAYLKGERGVRCYDAASWLRSFGMIERGWDAELRLGRDDGPCATKQGEDLGA